MTPVASARGFFEGVAARGKDPRLADLVGTWQFEVEGAGTWRIDVDRGALSVAEGPLPPMGASTQVPTSRFHIREDELLKLARGEDHRNVITGVLRGTLTVDGDAGFAVRLHTLLAQEEGST